MKRLPLILIILLAVSCGPRKTTRADVEPQKDTVYPLGFCTDSFRVASGEIKPGDNFMAWITRLGVPSDRAYALLEACDTVFDVRKLRAGNTWKAYYRDSTRLDYIVYDNSRTLQTVFSCADSAPSGNTKRR